MEISENNPTDKNGTENGLFEFEPEIAYPIDNRLPPWRILAVDDDKDFQRTTAYALQDVNIFGRPLELVQAYSMAEASTLLASDRHFAIILLDVVMETDNAGLRLAKAIREILGYAELRIILLTGQPGMAPMRSIMNDYDINEYCIKSEVSTSKLLSVLTAELRTYDQLKTISTARRGLQLIVESSNRLLNKHELTSYCDAALTEIALLLGIDPEGVVCARVDQINHVHETSDLNSRIVIVGAAGKLRYLIGQSIYSLSDPIVIESILRAIRARSNMELADATILFFPEKRSGADFVIYLSTGRSLLDTERQILHAFASNISGGLQNVALFSRLDRLAYHDAMLNMPNKNALLRAIDRTLSSEDRSCMALLIVDLDDFGGANHTFGVDFGDALLLQFAERLSNAVLPPGLVARIGADVFGILDSSENLAIERINETLETPFFIDGTPHLMTACIASVAMADVEVTGTASDVVRLARLALKEAKRQGPGSFVTYDKSQEVTAIKRFQVLHYLQQALDSRQLFLLYQPKIDLATREVVGVEALLRWTFQGRAVPPDEFIPVAEASTLIHSLGYMVMEEVCKAIALMNLSMKVQPVVCVNVSGKQFSDPALIPSMLDLLSKYHISPQSIELEVTETAMMDSFDKVASALRLFRDAGGSVSIDDFGTGYSSLKYLRELPADTLKIDRSFVSALEDNTGNGNIADMVIKLARSLGMLVIAEGVENEAQEQWLCEHQCDLGQGWLYAKPMTLDALLIWLDGKEVKPLSRRQAKAQ
ncbi:MAG: two-component system response regulator [Gammaproteobacteria bacterium]